MPLHEAAYLASTDKIYGVMDNYVVMFNADTGVREAYAKVCAPGYGPMRIAGAGSTLLVSCGDDYSLNADSAATSNKAIFSINPATLASTKWLDVDTAVRTALGYRPYENWAIGPRQMIISGGYVYFVVSWPGAKYINRAEIADPSSYTYSSIMGTSNFLPEQFDTNGVDSIWHCDANSHQVLLHPIPFGAATGSCPTGSNDIHPVAVVYDSSVSKAFAVCGDTNLMRCDTFGAPGTSTILNLGLIYADVKPMRIRKSGIDGNLYIPCQHKDVVIVYDASADNGTYVDGFDSPIDVVFTPTKAWAVQSSGVSLLEIT